MHHELFAQLAKHLETLDGWFTKATAHATAKNYDVNVLLAARLAPDMFPLVRQIQLACDTAKLAASRITGKEAPPHADTEQTIDELRRRIASVARYLTSYQAADFSGVESRTVSLPRWEGKVMTASSYFLEHALPNFYFHLAMAYAILRHNGVEIGKRDFLGPMTYR